MCVNVLEVVTFSDAVQHKQKRKGNNKLKLAAAYTLGAIAALIIATSAQASVIDVTPTNPQGWIADDNRVTGTTTFTGSAAYTGNGSLQLTTQGPADKASFSLYWNATTNSNPFGVSTTVGNLNSLSFQWLRNSNGSDPSASLAAPALRFYFLNDVNGNGVYDSSVAGESTGSLVYEWAYNNSGAPAPENVWVEGNLMNAYLWQRSGGVGGAGNLDVAGGFLTLSQWLDPGTAKPSGAWSINANTLITGFTISAGSGLPAFNGNVDDVSAGFGGNEVKTNDFNAVPEPTSTAFFVATLCGCVIQSRFRRGAPRRKI